MLREDGSPPLYYLLLAVWTRLFGTGEQATHALSLTFALLAIPAAFWVADAIFGRRAAWIAALLATVSPFLTGYAQETRMYTLVMLLCLLAAGALVRAFVFGERRFLVLLWLTLVLLLYTHGWSVFFCVGVAVATAICLRSSADARGLRDALLVAAATLAAFAPWLPTFLFQARHTGAPWSDPPSFHTLLSAPSSALYGDGPTMVLLLAAGSGLVAVLRTRRASTSRTAILALIGLTIASLATAWIASRISPAWASRYLAIVLGPLILLAAAGLARAGRLGLVGLALVLVYWTTDQPSADKSNVREVAAALQDDVRPGDLVLSTQPEQVPVIAHYMPKGLRYATLTGPVRDPYVMDWRDAVERVNRANPATTFAPLLARQPPGSRVVVIAPVFRDYRAWKAEWTRLVYFDSLWWSSFLDSDPRFVHSSSVVFDEIAQMRRFFKPVRADVYTKRPQGRSGTG